MYQMVTLAREVAECWIQPLSNEKLMGRASNCWSIWKLWIDKRKAKFNFEIIAPILENH